MLTSVRPQQVEATSACKHQKSAISSVVEQCLDMAEVVGSNPILRTIFLKGITVKCDPFFCTHKSSIPYLE